MGIQATYLGMPLHIDDLDVENLAYFKHCAAHDFHLQQCSACGLLRYPPTTACPWCMSPKSDWVPVDAQGRGAFLHRGPSRHSAGLQGHTPYLILLVDLDTQKGKPTEHEALRVVGNLATPDGKLAPPDMVRRVGIGTRVRMVFADAGPGSRCRTGRSTRPQPSPTSRGVIRRSEASCCLKSRGIRMAQTSKDRRSTEALAALLPAGVMGLSMALAAADATAATAVTDAPNASKSVADRLETIRGSVSEAWKQAYEKSEPYVALDPETKLAWWGNGGWRNGGWRNGGWGNGGWHNWGNGWHNGGWGNGGWNNWGNGGLLGGLLSPLIGSPWGNGWRNW